jgi:hypothetical protein
MGEWAMGRDVSERISAVYIGVLGALTVLSRRLECRPDFQRRMIWPHLVADIA